MPTRVRNDVAMGKYESGEYAFKFLFGEKFNSFKNIFDHNIKQLKKQLDKEELNECDSKACLVVLKKQFETFFDLKSPLSYSYQYQSNLALQKENFQEYAHYNTESLKNIILSYLNSIEKRIEERACHEEELRIKERNVKERKNELKQLNEIELQKQESMMNVETILNDNLNVTKQQGKSSSPGKDTNAKGAKICKNGSDYDITIAKSSHDKDKTKVQWSNNGLFKNDHEVEKTTENNKALKEANDLLTKELKTYKEKLYDAYELRCKNVQLHVFDSEETLKDAEKSRLKMKEFQIDEKVQELKIKPIDYLKLNKLYEALVLQVELSLEQKYFSETFISSETPSNASTSKSPCASMPSPNNMKLYLEKMENEISTLFELLQKSSKCESIFSEDIKEMMDVFYSMESDLDKTLKGNECLNDRLLEATLAEDAKNFVITSCVEIRNKNLQDEIERFSKESQDVSNKSKTADTFCNDAFDVTEEMSKRLVDLEKYLSKLEAKSIAFEIALQHKSQKNNSLKTLQKENENFLISLQIKNAHLKQTYKDSFESVQRSRVETNQCAEVKVKFDFDEIETKNIELEHQMASLLKENEHLKLVYKNLFDSIKKSQPMTQNLNIPQNEVENLKSEVSKVVDNKLGHILGKNDSSPSSITESNISKLEKESGEKKNNCENAKCELQTKIVELEKESIVNLKGKYVETKFDKPSILGKPPVDKLLINSQISKSWFVPKVVVQKDLSKPDTAQNLPKNEKDQLLKQIASLESKLASQDLRSCQKEYHELRISYNAIRVDFEKAFDSVSWKYLDFVLLNLGFGFKWCSWINACLSSSQALILVNGSPTLEFSIKRGPRQRDPLSPFLFILVMEGLHNALSIAVSSGLIRGAKFGSPEVTISHLLYVNDVIITTEWNTNDLDSIIRVLQVFYLASGLKINIQKSNVYGIGVSDVDVSSISNNSGCVPWSFLFTYLGLPIGSNMSLTSSWQVLLDSLGIYYFYDFKVPESVLNSLEISRAMFLGSGVGGCYRTKTRSRLKLSKLYMVRKVALITMVAYIMVVARVSVSGKILGLILDRLPYKLNLSSRGIDILAIYCPSCNGNVESSNDIFFECNIAKDIWMLVRKWCDISFPLTSYEHWKGWFTSWHVVKEKSRRLSVISSSSFWWLWMYRNNVTFHSHPMRKSDIFDNIRLSSYSWLHHRGHMISNWIDWLKSHMLLSSKVLG
ncbi:reverse transcriptase zinc-binding domain-containing protein [Tanacetum coccineum]